MGWQVRKNKTKNADSLGSERELGNEGSFMDE